MFNIYPYLTPSPNPSPQGWGLVSLRLKKRNSLTIVFVAIRVYAPRLQELLSSEGQLRNRPPDKHIGFVVEKSPQCQKNSRFNRRREVFFRVSLCELPIRIILGNGESHLQILLDKHIKRGIISNAEVRLGKL